MVTCMDRRLDVMTLFDLQPGDAYVIRNAGGILTDDVRRSLAIAQHALGVEQVVLVHHTDCGMSRLDDEDFVARLARRTGVRPTWEPGGFRNVADDVRAALRELAADPHVPGGAAARGFVYDVGDGTLTEVTADTAP
ncbi:beta-class carbonic anhydrase [Actinomyces howellii]|nr:carbonic anhydrase [Actinomyces howellii]